MSLNVAKTGSFYLSHKEGYSMENIESVNILERFKQLGMSYTDISRETGIHKTILAELRTGKRKEGNYLPKLRALLQEQEITSQSVLQSQGTIKSLVQIERDMLRIEQNEAIRQRLLKKAYKAFPHFALSLIPIPDELILSLYFTRMHDLERKQLGLLSPQRLLPAPKQQPQIQPQRRESVQSSMPIQKPAYFSVIANPLGFTPKREETQAVNYEDFRQEISRLRR